MVLYNTQITKALIRLRGCAGWSVPVLFANPQRQVFSRQGPIRMMWFFNVLPPSKQLGQSYRDISLVKPEASSIMRALSGARCTDVRLYTL